MIVFVVGLTPDDEGGWPLGIVSEITLANQVVLLGHIVRHDIDDDDDAILSVNLYVSVTRENSVTITSQCVSINNH